MLTLHYENDDSLSKFVESLSPSSDWLWAWENYCGVIKSIITAFDARRVCEIGGGRSPLFSEQDNKELGLSYTVNDISQSELNKAPEWVDKVCFDIASPTLPKTYYRSFDFVFSKMVLEHVRESKHAYENMYLLLRGGGIAFNFHPVLYSSPFVANLLMPERISQFVLRHLSSERNEDKYPKFPARYSRCVINSHYLEMLREIGFSKAVILPFYGHMYFRRIRFLQSIEDFLCNLARKRNFLPYASYCYTLVRK